MQPKLAPSLPNTNHDGDEMVKQLSNLVEQNRLAYESALEEFRSDHTNNFAPKFGDPN